MSSADESDPVGFVALTAAVVLALDLAATAVAAVVMSVVGR